MSGDETGLEGATEVCFAFDDMTGEIRSPAQLQAFIIADLRAAANRHDFDLNPHNLSLAVRCENRYVHATSVNPVKAEAPKIHV
jgi:hypothetical protein